MPKGLTVERLGDRWTNSPWAIPWQAGRFYMAGIWPKHETSASFGPCLVATPTPIVAPITVVSLQAVLSSAGSGTGNWLFGIYDQDEEGWPGDKIYGSSAVSVDLTTTAAYGVTGLTVLLQPGLYWFVLAMREAASVKTVHSTVSLTISISGNDAVPTALVQDLISNQGSRIATLGLPSRFERISPGDSVTRRNLDFLASPPKIVIGT